MKIGPTRNGRNRDDHAHEPWRPAVRLLAVALISVSFLGRGAAGQDPGANGDAGTGPGAAAGANQDPNVQVLTRGPVHEAFAAPVNHDPKPGLIVAKEPPAAVEELPPDQKPAGQNVHWIPGYWSWDQSRNDYLWVSGVWREPPPGRQWVPGYWHQVDSGFQWVPGAWVPVSQPASNTAQGQPASGSQAAYLPPPPASLETGPNGPAPAPNVFWSPGSWYWHVDHYVWRPGFWSAVQTNWVWIPPHYVATPGGYLFVEGYWDMPLADRGMMFAPVYYPQPVYMQPGYVYSPSITIGAQGMMASMFVQPSYSHYCFGDYYDRTFISVGIVPWFSFTYVSGPAMVAPGPPVYNDPLFAFYVSVNITRNPGWVTQIQRQYVVCRDNVAMRPPRTFIEQTRIIERNGRAGGGLIATPLHQLASRSAAGGGMRLEHVSADARRQWQQRGVALQQLRNERAIQERRAASEHAAGAGGGRGLAHAQARPRPLSLPPSPVAAAHNHASASESARALGHSDRGLVTDRAGERSVPRYEQSGVRVARQPDSREPGGSFTQHQATDPASMPDHLSRAGQSAPHDVARSSSVDGESAGGERETNARTAGSRPGSPSQSGRRAPSTSSRHPARREPPAEGNRTP